MSSGAGPQFGERAAYGPDDVCYRHPARHSFTLCQRCGRTICAQCQVVSSVGVLCPNCVRESQPGAAKRAKRSATVMSRRASGQPVVTYGIMAACALVFIAQWLSARFGGNEVTEALWYAPLYSLPQMFEPWRMLTAMFTHSTGFLLHILFNLFALWLFGRNLEQSIGRTWFLVLYVYAGLGGALGVLGWVYVDLDSIRVATVGASGAIFGILAATLVAYRAARVNITSLAVLIAINLGIGFLPGASISWQSHLGGMLIGAAAMWVLLATRGPRRRSARVFAMIGLGAALLALSASYLVVSPLPIG